MLVFKKESEVEGKLIIFSVRYTQTHTRTHTHTCIKRDTRLVKGYAGFFISFFLSFRDFAYITKI